MLILRSSPASPFGRKVKIVARILGLIDGIEIVAADTADPGDTLRSQNPLGKIPALILEDGMVIYDSRVIADYLDHLAGGGIVIPAAPEERYPALVMQALADGIMDASLLQVYEKRWREEPLRSAAWLDHHAGKVGRGLDALGELGPGAPIHVGTIAVACALGYLDLRFAGSWRGDYPGLVAFLDDFAARVPAFDATRPAA
ncbi:glutathione S-transferase family protein [Kaistia dalseonensis]|uniref:Glutathione S-transferase n=1 Tax=Kaistia dalseonensis TaxID=410840 RepID=A0ABU0H0J0_9HYPH|nr:glutathione S-transferase family protein [Kaistia dalseonensis]MCX5493242.1 glutathione S-transferase family protein [Kaistia dalseonensis]MDQ0435797.1 glutathione S-transferase [Kaistia dalseonensis]